MFKEVMSIFLALLLKVVNTRTGCAIMYALRDCFIYVPFTVRQFIISGSIVLPLRLTRFFLRFVTSPIGNDKRWIQKVQQKTWKGVWIAPTNISNHTENATSNDMVVLYIHGGGFSMGHSAMYMETFQLMINHLRDEHQIRASILSVEYSLSPENVWPKALNESMDAYRYLIYDLGVDPAKVVLVGDSAGGNLVAAMLLTIKDQIACSQEPILFPAGAALISPWTDLTPNQRSFVESKKHDLLSPNYVTKFVSCYIPNYDQLDNDSKKAMIHNPLISPFFGDFYGVCPIFVAYGGKELLWMSIEGLIEKLKQQGCNTTVLKGKNTPHVWIICRLMAPSKQIFENDCKSFINWLASTCKS